MIKIHLVRRNCEPCLVPKESYKNGVYVITSPERYDFLISQKRIVNFYLEKNGRVILEFPGQIKPPRFGAKDSNRSESGPMSPGLFKLGSLDR